MSTMHVALFVLFLCCAAVVLMNISIIKGTVQNWKWYKETLASGCILRFANAETIFHELGATIFLAVVLIFTAVCVAVFGYLTFPK